VLRYSSLDFASSLGIAAFGASATTRALNP
jgi:hypothetical protein